jgi:hypothetical protein
MNRRSPLWHGRAHACRAALEGAPHGRLTRRPDGENVAQDAGGWRAVEKLGQAPHWQRDQEERVQADVSHGSRERNTFLSVSNGQGVGHHHDDSHGVAKVHSQQRLEGVAQP